MGIFYGFLGVFGIVSMGLSKGYTLGSRGYWCIIIPAIVIWIGIADKVWS